jgi:pimeloyl-ACP methyl ester carboxylesterase
MVSMVPAAAATAWSEREAVLAVEPSPLHGTLTLPAGDDPIDAALILAGSGPTDRDGNGPGYRNDSLKLLAQVLAADGIASLRVDKRGIAASRAAGSREEDLRFETYVEDAVRWVEWLRAELRIRRVFLIGHSEGALVATLAAQRTPTAGLVLIAGIGSPAAIVIRRQLAAAGLPKALLAQAEETLSALERGERVADPPPGLAALFRPSVQPYLISWLPLDPAAELARAKVPTLIIQGTTDLQVTLDDAQKLAKAAPRAELATIEGMNHVLKPAPPDRAANLATYNDPAQPLAAELLPAIVAFMRQ